MSLAIIHGLAAVFLIIIVWNPGNLTVGVWFQAFAMHWAIVLTAVSVVTTVVARRPAGLIGLIGGVVVLLGISVVYSYPTNRHEAPATSHGDSRESEDRGPYRLRVATANLLMVNTKPEEAAEALIALEADVLVLHEYNRGLYSTIHPLLSTRFAHAVVHPTQDAYGMGVYSNVPVSGSVTDAGDHPALRVEMSAPDLTLWAAHPVAPMSGEMVRRQMQHLAAFGKAVAADSSPLVVAGDFNAVPWNGPFRRMVRRVGLVHAVPPGRGLPRPTYPSRLTWFGVPIDQMLVKGAISTHRRERFRIPGSDHLGVLVELEVH